MLGRRIGVVAGVLVAVVTVAGCGEPQVRFQGHELSADVSFVADIEQRFHDDNEHGTVKVGDGARCWLLRSRDTGELDQRAACGPVRHLGAAQGGVWDLYTFTGALTGKTLTVSDVAVDRTGQTLPADREPYRGDEAKIPANADALSAPDPPPARPGMAAVVTDVPLESPATPEKGRLTVPGAVVEAIEIGGLKAIPGDEQSPLYGPAEGEEFRAIRIKISPGTPLPDGSVDATAAYSVKSGGNKTGIDPTGGENGRLVVVSVPKGKDADLVVRVAGVDQSMSVRTGDRTSVTAGAYYRASTTIPVDKAFPAQRVRVGRFDLAHRVTFTDATLTPFDPAKGWAPTGQSWLELSFTGATTNTVGAARGAYRWTTDTRRLFTVTDDKGRGSLAVVPPSLTGAKQGAGVVRIPVADDAGWVQLGYRPTGAFEGTLTPRTGRYAFKPIAFRITLPQ